MLISSVLFFFLPLLVWGVVYYHEQQRGYMSQVTQRQQLMLDGAMKSLDNRLSYVAKINGLLAASPLIKDIYENAAGYHPDTVYQIINSFCNSNDLIGDLYLYFEGDRWVYGRDRRILLRFFDPSGIRDEEFGLVITLDGRAYLKTVMEPANFGRFAAYSYRFLDQENRSILYSMPVYRANGKVQLLSTILLDTSKIMEALSYSAFDQRSCSMIVYDNEGNPMLAAGRAGAGAISLAAAQAGGNRLQSGGISWMVQTAASNVAGWTAVLLTDTGMLSSGLFDHLLLGLAILSALLAVGIIALVMFLRANYAPVFGIYEVAQRYISSYPLSGSRALPQDLSGARDPHMKNNEITIIRRAIDDLISRVFKLSDTVASYHGLLEQEFFMDVINGQTVGKEAFLSRAQTLGMELENCSYCMFIIEHSGILSQVEAVHNRIRSLFGGGMRVYSLTAPSIRCTPWLCVMNPGEAGPEELLRAGCGQIAQALGIAVHAGIGGVYQDHTQISSSCLEAYAALDFLSVTGRRILTIHEVKSLFPQIDLSGGTAANIFSTLNASILEGDMEAVRRDIQSIQRLFSDYGLSSIIAVRRTCFDAHNAVMEALRQAGLPQGIGNTLVQDLFRIQTVEDAAALLGGLESLIEKSFSARAACLDIDGIIEKIRDGYSDPGFSINTLAVQANMPNSSFSRRFKALTGVLPIDYLTNLRMEKARELLAGTDLPIAEIVQEVGYYSTSSFIKRFRIHTGCTPGEYRALRKAAAGDR